MTRSRNGRSAPGSGLTSTRRTLIEAPPPRGGRAVVAAAVLGLATVLAGGLVLYVVGGDDDPPHSAHSPLAAEDYPDLGLGHVHALGVDPADGVLYAAGHYGVFRVPAEGEPSRVADRYQDTMGFTVTGPRTFLGSGHPDLRENLPSRLGLIESTDAGNSWTALSLSGQADFHTLHAVHGQVYGYESSRGAFMVSSDRVRWDTRSTRAVLDFVVDPRDPDTVLATAPEGLLRSTDGGRTWSTVPAAPELVRLAWAGPQALYGIGADGSVHHSGNGGTGWTPRGNAGGEPAALHVEIRTGAETVYVAVSERGIVQSTDGGTTFTTRYREDGTP